MPRSVEQIVDDLNDKLRLSGNPVITMRWPDFYKLSDMQRFKEPRPEQIKKRAKSEYGLIVEYGDAVVLVAHDRNFSPA